MIVRITVETPEHRYPETNVPREIKFSYRQRGGGDHPGYFADEVQRAVTAAAEQACQYMERLVDLRKEPIVVRPYVKGVDVE